MPKDNPGIAGPLGGKPIPKPQDQLRIRAAWLYYIEGMTQSDVAKKLGINRIAVTRLLSEAKKRSEVVIRIKSELTELVALEQQLQARFGLRQAIVAPMEAPEDDPTRVIAAAAGAFVSELMQSDMTVGVGWGKTLHAMLPFIEERSLSNVRVVSLLGGIAQARRFNPAEFAWQFAELFEAEGYLISAPAVVDSAQTRHALLENCGLDQILSLAESCDVVLLSCGGITTMTTSYRSGHINEAARQALIEQGAVGDLLYHFLDAEGRLVDHSVNTRSISMPINRLRRVPEKVLMSGGREKVGILKASMASIEPTVLVTDEVTARTLLDEAAHSPATVASGA